MLLTMLIPKKLSATRLGRERHGVEEEPMHCHINLKRGRREVS